MQLAWTLDPYAHSRSTAPGVSTPLLVPFPTTVLDAAAQDSTLSRSRSRRRCLARPGGLSRPAPRAVGTTSGTCAPRSVSTPPNAREGSAKSSASNRFRETRCHDCKCGCSHLPSGWGLDALLVEAPALLLQLARGQVLLQRSGLEVEDEEERVHVQLVEDLPAVQSATVGYLAEVPWGTERRYCGVPGGCRRGAWGGRSRPSPAGCTIR
eukprot:2347035-Rhodomonas_salina.3